ncbi:MAG: hypothetical protein Q8P12_07555, partial [bacterium]|nr:hypothetical protein [bacterium]
MSDFEKLLSSVSEEVRIFMLERVPALLVQGGDLGRAHHVLTDYAFLQAKVREVGAQALLQDYDTVLGDSLKASEELDGDQRRDMTALRFAIRTSSHV